MRVDEQISKGRTSLAVTVIHQAVSPEKQERIYDYVRSEVEGFVQRGGAFL
jgi:hypothetical protein